MGSEDDKFWFHAKAFGWGWGLPARWQGWAVLFVYLAAIAAAAILLGDPQRWLVIAVMTVLFIVVVAFKGERPVRWRWGRRDD